MNLIFYNKLLCPWLRPSGLDGVESFASFKHLVLYASLTPSNINPVYHYVYGLSEHNILALHGTMPSNPLIQVLIVVAIDFTEFRDKRHRTIHKLTEIRLSCTLIAFKEIVEFTIG